jgi:MFS transporter, NNP family, nitrate/nitrite transporter
VRLHVLFDGKIVQKPLNCYCFCDYRNRVPITIFVVILVLVFGQDHPAGKWSERHNIPAAVIASERGRSVGFSSKDLDTEAVKSTKEEGVGAFDIECRGQESDPANFESKVDLAINEPLTMKTGVKIILSPVTWLPALAYLSTFGLELTLDGAMANTLFSLFSKQKAGFTQNTAGYYTSIL